MSVNIETNEYNPFNKYKVLAWYDRMKRIETGNFDAPVNIALDVLSGTSTHKLCGGFQCSFCMSNFSPDEKVARIPKEILFTMPHFFHDWGVKSLCLAGHNSDPLMYNHNDMIEFLRLCQRFNIEVGFVSNGAFYTDAMIEEVARTCNWSGWSINAGKAETHLKITGSDKFNSVISNIEKMSEVIEKYRLKHDIGYKFLITDDNYMEIIDAIKLSSEIGVRHLQIRPCELPIEKSKKIDVSIVEEQIKEGIERYERPGEFEVFGVREKFKSDFTKITPKRCIASPLGSTWMADGSISLCPDRRWSVHQPNMSLGNFIEEGLEAIRRKWGGVKHKKMIEEANKQIDSCIRCTSLSWHNIYEEVIVKDSLDITLI